MSDFEHEQPPTVSQYGAQLRAAWLAHHQANADMAERAAVEAHGQTEDHRVVQAGQGGLFGHVTPQQMGASVASRTRRVGEAWGVGRDITPPGLEMGTGTIGPAPARRDLTRVNDHPGYAGTESPLMRWARENQ